VSRTAKRLLVIEPPNPTDGVGPLTCVLSDIADGVTTVHSLASAAATLGEFDVAILDLSSNRDFGPGSVAVMKTLRPELPVLVRCTDDLPSDADTALAFGAEAVFSADAKGAARLKRFILDQGCGTDRDASGQPHVLVVDDEPNTREILKRYLDWHGIRVTIAADGAEALDRFGSDPADLVITDLFMPELDGEGLVRELRNRRPDVPVIVISGHSIGEERYEWLRRSVIDVYHKPLDLGAIARTVQRFAPSAVR
jgi:CheY-like chemotaxis protein